MITWMRSIEIFILFCLSIGNATFSPYAKWLLTLENAENQMYNDLTSQNDPMKYANNNGLIPSDYILCSCFRPTFNDAHIYGIVNSITEESTTEYGVSVWIYVYDFSGAWVTFGATENDVYYGLGASNTGGSFYTDSNSDETNPIPFNKWVLLVFYFTKSSSNWLMQVFFPDITTSISLLGNVFPGSYIMIAEHSAPYYYEVQVFKKAQNPTKYKIDLYDNSNEDYSAVTTTCTGSCADYCHPDAGCLSTSSTCSCPALCICASATNGLCTSCKDNATKSGFRCQCNSGFVADGGSCVKGNFYIGMPDNCVVGSKNVCTQCEKDYFLYDNTASTTICLGNFYLGCDSCDTCNASPICFECAKIDVKDGSSCRVDSVGYQISFSSKNIIIDFAHPLSSKMKMDKFIATTETHQDVPTSNWIISESSTLSQYIIATDLTESQLPLDLDFSFDQVSLEG